MILGSSGFLGTHLVEALEDKHELVLIDREEPILESHKDRFFKYDLTKPIDLKTFGAEMVINLASSVGVKYIQNNPESFIKNNALLIEILIPELRELKVPVIFTSTSEVYDGLHFDDTRPLSTSERDFYALNKLYTESVIFNTFYSPAIVFRLFNIVGKYQNPESGVFANFYNKMMNNDVCEIHISSQNFSPLRSFTSVEDFIFGIEYAIKDVEDDFRHEYWGQTYDIIAPENIVTIERLYKMLRAHFEAKGVSVKDPIYSEIAEGEIINKIYTGYFDTVPSGFKYKSLEWIIENYEK
jgi:nucleoside-diphosphate-sugar epimerase